ncbi:FMN-dependent NADH-azoreductase [Salinimonas sp. HHU 13199]|uniref:FMN dependent NADH:quinone oxidoreductase n=1 Tax=Salinimonas profundi TaxID=2729140 RepID=A0ABR8LG26_9ALTE|nr:NAD(P)H-dependent oxidoreductase [Salinimonas profundi]MBD3584677.1 FMN-dependent NADH-azoreductase [Salinimonas profundi]
MSNILVINSSLNEASGNSSKLTEKYIETLQASKSVSVTSRNLYASNLGHLEASEMEAWMTDADSRTDEQAKLAELSDTLIAEVQAADEIVIGVPMYNFGIPSALKAWIDRIARAGITFRYTENGPQGLLEGKKVTILAARGGQYVGTPMDTQTEYLKHFFAFIGITDIRFVYAEGLAMGDEQASKAFNNANEKIVELTSDTVD